jgi:hypothetical protein
MERAGDQRERGGKEWGNPAVAKWTWVELEAVPGRWIGFIDSCSIFRMYSDDMDCGVQSVEPLSRTCWVNGEMGQGEGRH